MSKTLILNLSDTKLQGNILDVGESFGVIYNISKEVMGEIAIDYIAADNPNNVIEAEYDTCTMFFNLSSIWSNFGKIKLIEEITKYIKVGGEILIWDINKEPKQLIKNKIMAILPSGKIKEFEFKNLNPLAKSALELNEKLLEKHYKIEETKLWEDIHFIKAVKL
jgi:hypothetical protein